MRAGWCLYYKRWSMERGFDASEMHLRTPGGFICASFLFVFVLKKVCQIVLSVSFSLVVTCWERAGLMVLLSVTFCYVFVTFPIGVLGQVWYLIVYIPDHCRLPYFGLLSVLWKWFCCC